MEKKITLAQLAETISRRIHIEGEDAEKWVKEYFAVIADAMASGDSVKVKGFGTFKVSGIDARESVDVSTGKRVVIPGHQRASFTPDKAFAEAVNAPFAAFEAVELADDVTEEELSDIAPNLDQIALTDEVAAEESNQQLELLPEPLIETELVKQEDENREENADDKVDEVEEAVIPEVVAPSETVESAEAPEELEEETDVEAVITSEESEEDEEDYNSSDFDEEPIIEEKRNRRGFLPGFFVGIACMFAILAGFWCWYRFAPDSFDSILGRPNKAATAVVASNDVKQEVSQAQTPTVVKETGPKQEPKDSIVTSVVEEKEVVDEVPTRPSDEVKKESDSNSPVYDVISKTRYLTTMAREHYGSYVLWPYIYEENKQILGHPDRIKPGTKVVIPPAEKYGIDRKNKACMDKARKMAEEIYGRYNK